MSPRWVCCYDVRDDARRGRVHRLLTGTLRPVQYSVFEGALAPDARRDLVRGLHERIDPAVDSVRLYPLCGRCLAAVVTLGATIWVPDPTDTVL